MNKNYANLFILVILVAFVVGGLSGGWFGSYYTTKILQQISPQTFGSLNPLTPFKSVVATSTAANSAPLVFDREKAIEDSVAKITPAVVSIVVTKDLPVYEQYYYKPFGDDPFFQQFQVPGTRQNGTQKQEVGGGSGFIVTADGLIVTNRHVVSDEQAEYTVVTNDGKKYSAQVLARDTVMDVALIKIDKTGLPTVSLGDSAKLKLGQSVIAVGNALGEFSNTVSVGIISGLSRSLTAGGGGIAEQLVGVIQTDAAINPGNSGGPLINLTGQVIGINTAMAQGAQSIGFALPINDIKKIIDSVKKTGKIVRPFLGIRYVMINETIKEKNSLSVDYGALIVRGDNPEDLAVTPGSPADKAGLLENDIILEVNKQKLTESNPLANILGRYNVGEEVTLKVLSKGQEKTVKVKLEEKK